MNKKLEKILKNTFVLGSIRDSAIFLDMCLKNAFPEFNFRGLEVTNLVATKRIIEGKSWNHVFKAVGVDTDDGYVWEVSCHRVSQGKTDDKKVLLSSEDLSIIG